MSEWISCIRESRKYIQGRRKESCLKMAESRGLNGCRLHVFTFSFGSVKVRKASRLRSPSVSQSMSASPQLRQTVVSKQITTSEPKKGELLSYLLTDLRIPLSYEVWLTPVTMYGQGDAAYRVVQYSERESRKPPPSVQTHAQTWAPLAPPSPSLHAASTHRPLHPYPTPSHSINTLPSPPTPHPHHTVSTLPPLPLTPHPPPPTLNT